MLQELSKTAYHRDVNPLVTKLQRSGSAEKQSDFRHERTSWIQGLGMSHISQFCGATQHARWRGPTLREAEHFGA